jgi:predicted ATPase
MIKRLAISGYRSLRDIQLDLDRLVIVTGPNGSGKTSLYRALRLLADIAQGRIIQSLAKEGGLQSTLWAGPAAVSRAMKRGAEPVQGTTRKHGVSLKLGFSSDDYGYAIDLGLPQQPLSAFARDPHIKVESLWTGDVLGRANEFARRDNASVRIRDKSGAWQPILRDLAPFDSMLTQCSDPREAPELLQLRETMRGWRFYDTLRTDPEAPARRPQIGTYTPILAGDGADLAAAIQTILEIGDADGLETAVADAFPGARLEIADADGYFELLMHQPGLLRPLKAAELSDGTLRYLLLLAALLSPRPPALIVLNEPESSLHPDLLLSLARLIHRASAASQIIVVTHSEKLFPKSAEAVAAQAIVLEKSSGETVVSERNTTAWHWPAR